MPTASNRASTDSWTVGLKELVFLGETVAPTGSLVIQSTPENLGSTSPAYGVVEGLDSGMTVDVSAEELAYTDTIRYADKGYQAWLLFGGDLAYATMVHSANIVNVSMLDGHAVLEHVNKAVRDMSDKHTCVEYINKEVYRVSDKYTGMEHINEEV